jgi:hypothetical protein
VPSELPPLDLHSSSGLSSTVLDLAKYSVALDEGRLGATDRMWTPSAPGMPYGYGWFTQQVAGERVVWHTSWWPDAFSGLLVKVPSRRLTLVLLANTDALVSPQMGASNVLLYPIARTFLQTFLDPGVRLDPASVSDADRLKLYLDVAAGERLLANFPDDVNLKFDLALAYGKVRPSLRINGEQSARAVALLEELVRGTRPLPKWMDAWSSYLVAEQLAASDPVRARALAERAKATGVNTDGLLARVEALLQTLGAASPSRSDSRAPARDLRNPHTASTVPVSAASASDCSRNDTTVSASALPVVPAPAIGVSRLAPVAAPRRQASQFA